MKLLAYMFLQYIANLREPFLEEIVFLVRIERLSRRQKCILLMMIMIMIGRFVNRYYKFSNLKRLLIKKKKKKQFLTTHKSSVLIFRASRNNEKLSPRIMRCLHDKIILKRCPRIDSNSHSLNKVTKFLSFF